MSEQEAITQEEISEADWADTPVSVRKLVVVLKGRIEQLETQIAGLQEQVNRNSGNSSQPASQNGAKGFQVKPKEKSKKRRGGQEGHQGHERQMYEAEDCARIEEHYPQKCWQCGGELEGRDVTPQRIQVVELPALKPVVKEHRFHAIECGCCGARTRAFEAEIVNGSGYGERLAGFVGLMSGEYRQSHRMVKRLLEEVFDIRISVGSVGNLRDEISEAVSAAVQEVQEYVQQQPIVNSDETSFSQGNADGGNPSKQRGWLWVLVTPLVCYFQVLLSRSQEAAQQVLGAAFRGYVGSDRYSGYSWLDLKQRQVCWAHLKRDFTKIAERSGLSAQIGKDLLAQQKLLFEIWYQVRDGTLSRTEFCQQVIPIRNRINEILTQGAGYQIGYKDKSPLAKTVRTCRQLLKVELALWLFVSVEGVEPTNNAAERALRPAVLWRRTSFGSQSLDGSCFAARMLTVGTTLRLQQRNVLDYLAQACLAKRNNLPSPSLLPVFSLIP